MALSNDLKTKAFKVVYCFCINVVIVSRIVIFCKDKWSEKFE
ncbi:hypothetical protein ACU8KH_04789 [Lachancea thermotolerans]